MFREKSFLWSEFWLILAKLSLNILNVFNFDVGGKRNIAYGNIYNITTFDTT